MACGENASSAWLHGRRAVVGTRKSAASIAAVSTTGPGAGRSARPRGRLGVRGRHRLARHPLRRGGVQHLDDRVPGDPHRPVVPRPDRGDDAAAHRQLRHRGRARRVAPALGRGVRRPPVHRPPFGQRRGQPAAVPARARHPGAPRDRHPQPGAAPARARRHARRRHQRALRRGCAGRRGARRRRRWRAARWSTR